jgi:hypothetical protein
MNYLTLYDGGGMVEPELPARVETDVEADPLFGNLTVHLHYYILEFVAPIDLMQFGRCCRSAAAMVNHSISEASIRYCTRPKSITALFRGFDTFIQKEVEKYGEHAVGDVFQHTQRGGEARGRLNAAVRSRDIIIKGLFDTFCCRLRTIMLLRRPESHVCPFTKCLVFHTAAYQVTFRQKWLEPLDRLISQLEHEENED